MSKRLFIAPHFADIAVSFVGLVAMDIENSIVVNIFTAKPKVVRRITTREYNQELERHTENRLRKILGYQYVDFGFRDSFARGRTKETYFTSNLNSEEEELVEKIKVRLMETIAKYDIKEVYSPQALRNHIDHFIVKEAVKKIPCELTLFYYEDSPDFNPETPDLSNDPHLEKIVVDISSVVNKKTNAVKLYKTTINTFYQSVEKVIKSIKKHPVELYWKVIDQ